jgi:ankyrin repeat protein
MTVLHYAAAAGRDVIVQFLIDKFGKEFVDQQDQEGRSALHVAVEAKNRRISGLLAVAGASLSLRSSHSLTAEETALKVGDEHLAAYLNRKCSDRQSDTFLLAINKKRELLQSDPYASSCSFPPLSF